VVGVIDVLLFVGAEETHVCDRGSCEHDAVTKAKTDDKDVEFINIKTLNEWDPKSSGMDWRQKLDSQRGAVLATELKNNACKLAKWTTCSLLAGSSLLRLGYVSRVNPVDSQHHVILGTQTFKPQEFATQIALNMSNGWAILRAIIDLIMKYEDGKYVIVKDPMKPIIRIYAVPPETFEDDDDSEEVCRRGSGFQLNHGV
jgi:translation initiation factor 3 subunit D